MTVPQRIWFVRSKFIRRALTPAALSLCFASAGCSDPLGPEQEALAEAMVRWTEAGLEDYVFEFQRLCFCGGDTIRELRIEVRAGSVSSATFVDNGAPVGSLEDVPTIEDLFEEIQGAIDQEAYLLAVDYHDELGHPVTVSIDYIRNAADDEMSFHTASLLPLAAAATYSAPPAPLARASLIPSGADARRLHLLQSRERRRGGRSGRGHPRARQSPLVRP